ncbi:hypothetical protein CSOJ01_10510 [Colletotrichum sojae]|uniref:Uncharacterized protein n=1 Tax=Colletotrichum sojae TaxID=2175907 RepID=A0A8H6J005_9PEZI|nr:hypothetical protein CSOJ01_10510 [Colletotrichum sojae]
MRDRRRVTPQPDRDKDLGNRHSEGKEYSHPVGTTAPSATRGGRQHRGPPGKRSRLVGGGRLGWFARPPAASAHTSPATVNFQVDRPRGVFDSSPGLRQGLSVALWLGPLLGRQPRGLLRPPVTYWAVGRETSAVESWGRESWTSGRAAEYYVVRCCQHRRAPPRSTLTSKRQVVAREYCAVEARRTKRRQYAGHGRYQKGRTCWPWL